ncbi:helix-turn-helix domain-containing protein [Hoeflea sp. G2-23]|uniref:Helix-turn-helix domain-containing protein n=1 Tax=Hoeflea algicola TaxID=2983763 RepID=A0ABT3Z5K1_9HYPH|nr:helix-turn-helix domain-containing protein [Hoeflea algicola]MCY0146586.1 helix-turn-helix domain-containing protein [Hoeflea algicola]
MKDQIMPTQLSQHQQPRMHAHSVSGEGTGVISLSKSLPPLLKEREVSDLLSVAPGTLRNWRISGTGPGFCKIAKSMVRYPAKELENWINATYRHSTSESGL